MGSVGIPAVLLLVLSAGALEASPTQYDISASESSLKIRLFSGGLLSVFGHDHLLVADGLAGRIVFDPDRISQSALQLSVPTATLIVDDPKLRAAEGIDGELSEEDVSEIRETLLGPEFLDAGEFPRVVVTAVEITGELPTLNVSLSVRIKQQEQVLHVPTRIEVGEGRIRVWGELFFKQTDFGIEPFSGLLGTLKVEDAVQVRFDVVGRAQ